MLYTIPGKHKYPYDVSSYLNSEDSSNYSSKSDPSLEPHSIYLNAYWASIPKCSQRDQLNIIKLTHQFCQAYPQSLLFFLYVMSLQTNSMITHPGQSPNEYLRNLTSLFHSHCHYFSSDSVHFSPGFLSEISISGFNF